MIWKSLFIITTASFGAGFETGNWKVGFAFLALGFGSAILAVGLVEKQK